jgi:hypothetical protein
MPLYSAALYTLTPMEIRVLEGQEAALIRILELGMPGGITSEHNIRQERSVESYFYIFWKN